MKHIAFVIPALLLAICFGTTADASDKIKLSRSTPFANDDVATTAVRNECQLPGELANYVVQYAGDNIELVDGDPEGGRVLKMKITQARSVGGAAPRSVAVEGELTQDGKVVGTFQARRITSSIGVCKALSRCIKALGKDIAAWLVNPTMDSRLGNAR